MESIAMILAGGEGTRLQPLTRERAKPAVPFGGNYRIIDFALSNFINSNMHQIYLITQFRSHSLMEHVRKGWRMNFFEQAFVETVPPQMRDGKRWYEGTADAIYQNINLIMDMNPRNVCIFGGDHIYKMDVRQMYSYHMKKQAKLTISAIPVPIEECSQFGIIEVDEDWRMVGFKEKPSMDEVSPIPGKPGMVMASMGNYIFERECLLGALFKDRYLKNSSHDFGKDIIPDLFPNEPVYVYDFFQNIIEGDTEINRGYWKDVGTLSSYMSANLDLVKAEPRLNMYSSNWPIRGYRPPFPPAKFVHNEGERRGTAIDSIVCMGSIISGATVKNSLLGPGCIVRSYSHIDQCVLLGYLSIGNNCRIRNAIIDKNAHISSGVTIGYDIEADRKLPDCFVTDDGLVVVPKGARL